MRKFPALSYSGSESDSLALFPDWIAFAGRRFMRKLFWKRFLRKRLSVYSVVLEKVARSRQCCVLWWTGSEKVRERPTWLWHGWPEDGFFQAHKDDTSQPSWPESCTLWVCILCTPPVELSVLRSGNPKHDYSACTDRTNLSFTAHHIARNATTVTSIAKWNLAMMLTMNTKYAAGLPAAPYTTSIRSTT